MIDSKEREVTKTKHKSLLHVYAYSVYRITYKSTIQSLMGTTAVNIPVAHHCNSEAGYDTAATLLGMFGSIRQLLHHSYYLLGRSGVFWLLKADRQVAEVTRRLGGHQANDLIC